MLPNDRGEKLLMDQDKLIHLVSFRLIIRRGILLHEKHHRWPVGLFECREKLSVVSQHSEKDLHG